ncbi:MAG: hypothetical protein IJ829_07170, partial [Kiritimatiellae bacterium]|nr:hypothetical protein [Kiritimatiellia bacterium]
MTASTVVLAATALAGGPGALSWRPLLEPGVGGAIVSVEVSPHDRSHLVAGGDMLGAAASF